MASIILISCGVGAAVCGIGAYLAKSKKIKKTFNKWLKRTTAAEGSNNAVNAEEKDNSPKVSEEDFQSQDFDDYDDMDVLPLKLPLTKEYPVIDDGTGKHFMFVTIIPPPPKSSPRREIA